MEKNAIPLSTEERKSLNSFSWNFILFIFTSFAGLLLIFAAFLSFIIWCFRKIYQRIEAFRFKNYETVVQISKDFRILKSKKTGKYGICKNLSFLFSPGYEDIRLTPTYNLLVQPTKGPVIELSFLTLEKDVA